MNEFWLLKMAQWVRHPPSMKRVIIGAVVLAAALIIIGADWLGLWPDWAHVTRARP